jgi:predicted MFS family arabinose efflux permease
LSAHQPGAQLGRGITLLLSLTCGVSVANIYFPQAISPLIASGLHVSPNSAALAVTAAQLGYAVGVFLLVPLGDRRRHRPLIVTLLTLTGLGLVAASAAPTLPILVGESAVIGLTTVVPQVIIPMAAGPVAENRRGALIGGLLSGLLGGILLARVFGGTVGEWLGWRAPYVVAAVLALLLAAVLATALPATNPPSQQRYLALLAESLRLLCTEPELRRSCLYQAALFAGFSAAWTSLALLIDGPTYRLGAHVVGLLALVGAGSVFCTPIAGRWIDRRGSDLVNLVCILGTIVAAVVLLAGGLGGAIGLVTLAAGLLLMDIAMQSSQVANQTRIFALRPEARSRLNTAYMTFAFLGSCIGSWLGVRAYTCLGWPGVCGLVAVLAVLALARHLLHVVTHRHSVVDAVDAAAEETISLPVQAPPSQLAAEVRRSPSHDSS